MKILYLGILEETILECIKKNNDEIIIATEKIVAESHLIEKSQFIISYRYQYILKPDILKYFIKKAINIHISLLPYNRGADPNLWSFLEDTPKGVTIHYLDQGIDTGDILVQREVFFSESETLKSSYEKLNQCAINLFCENWESIRNGTAVAFPQIGESTLHYRKDKQKYEHLLTKGWDTPVKDLIGKAYLEKV